MEVFSQWHDVLTRVLNQFVEQLALYLPSLFGAFLLLLVGWILAHALRVAATRMTQLGERAFPRIFLRRGQLPAKIPSASAKVFGNVIFWIVVLFFLTAATQVLGLHTFTAWLARIVDYLPTVLVGVLIIVAGYLLSQLAREVVRAAIINVGDRQKELIARVVQSGILVVAILVGAEQIGIKVTFLVILAAAIGISLVGTVALALSLGSREYVANLIGGHYLRQRYSIGQYVRIGLYEGRILELSETAVTLDTADGRASIPAKVFNEQAIILILGSTQNE
jgi:small-conductance mechanosensitive channel